MYRYIDTEKLEAGEELVYIAAVANSDDVLSRPIWV